MFDFDYQDTIQEINKFITKILSVTGRRRVVVGLSGGVDSAVVLCLLAKFIDPKDIYPAILPYGDFNIAATRNAYSLIDQLKISTSQTLEINIKPVVDQIISLDPHIDTIRKGNIMSRIRMIYLFDTAKKNNGLVSGTENRTEHLLGYFTRFGDAASDFEPIKQLYKTQIFFLARELNVSTAILKQQPTAGLWPGQTDEDEFGFTYKEADQVLHLFFDKAQSKEKIIRQGFNDKLVERIINRVNRNAFKHRVPYQINNTNVIRKNS